MANEIKLKRGSGSNPGTSDLVVGEVALRTDNASLFTKKDDGTIAEIGAAAGVSDGDKGDITVSNSGSTFTIANDAVTNAKIADDAVDSDQIANGSIDHVHLATDIIGPENIADGAVRTSEIQDDAVTFAKIQNISTNVFLGRLNAGDGSIEPLSASQTRSILNVENGATADQSASEIVALIADQTIAPSEIDMEDNEKIKLGIGDDLQLFHDGTNSIIKNDTNTLVIRSDLFKVTNNADNETIILGNANGSVELYEDNTKRFETTTSGVNIVGNLTLSGTVDGVDIATLNTFVNTINTSVASNTSKLNGIESGATADQSASEILTLIKTVDGAGSGLDADLLDGISSASFLRSDAADTFNNTLTWNGSAVGMPVDFATNDGYPSVRVIRNNASNAKGDGMFIGYSNSNNGITRIYGGGATTGGLDVRGSGVNDVKINGNTVWHAGNDGAGSGLDADTIDGISSASFLRSDASDTASGNITLSSVSNDVINFSGNDSNSNRGISFNSKTALSHTNADGWLRINNAGEFTNGVYTAGLFRADGGFQVDGIEVIDGSANIIAGRVSGTVSNATRAENLGGASPSVGASNGTIVQRHSSGYIFANFFNTTPNDVSSGITKICVETGNDGYIRHGTAAAVRSFLNVEDGATAGGGLPTTGGTLTGTLNARSIIPTANGSYDLGSNSARWRNIYTSDLNMSNEGGSNDIDGSWGSYTIQEGSDDLFLINKRNGKKYKFNLTEIKGS